MKDQVERKRLAILHVLMDEKRPVSSKEIAEILEARGYATTERTVRFHLQAMDDEGLTRYIGKKGRILTESGRRELSRARAHEKVGFLSSRIAQMTYGMDFDYRRREGKLVVNVSYIERQHAARAAGLMSRVFEAGYAMGSMLTLFEEGEEPGEMKIPRDHIGIGTICSIAVNGILLREGIPVRSLFGGLLELRGHEATRFVEIINYDGTTIDPLEIFIKSGMTDYLGATSSGNGLIGASFREIPAGAVERVEEVAADLEKIGLKGFYLLGQAGQTLLDIPVGYGSAGAVIIGGLNPVAILEESGIPVQSKALSSLVDYSSLFHYHELGERLK
jgi:HTH-type transcriptional regulator, global nitrogen regulator NrpRI